ncbi:MAG: M28 family peptidase [Planctomycetota bacterium]|jgi:hypothetical protein
MASLPVLTSCAAGTGHADASLDIAFPLPEAARELDPDVKRAFSTITPMDTYTICKWLADDRFAGRYPGTPEYTAMCEWVADRFAAWGIQPGGPEGSFLQPYPSPHTIVHSAEMTLFVPKQDAGAPERAPGDAAETHEEAAMEEAALEACVDFIPHLYSDRGEATAGVVFAGWGISAPDLEYDDYADVDIAGKFVLCFRGTPDRNEDGFTEHDHHRKRMLTAKERGAVGLVYIYEEVSANPNGDLIEGFLPALVTEKTADRLLAASGVTSAELRRELQESKKPRSFETAGRIRLKVKAEHFPDAEAYNVIGFIEGSDPVLKSEFIVIGGHIDHCGRHMGRVFPGADDNASGSACVIAAARAFAALERPPKRSVLFALFGSEERGLLGSNLLADNLPPQAEKVVTMFNLDMEGEGDGVGAVHSPGRTELKEAIERADRCVGAVRRIREFRGVGVRSSDYAPFYLKEIPCIAFWSNGPHLHYHQPGDTIYRINPDMLADVSRLAFLTAHELADG